MSLIRNGHLFLMGIMKGLNETNGQWAHIVKVFNQVTPEGQEPVPSPIKDAQGNTEEDKLKNNYPANMIPVEDTPATPPAKTKVKKKGLSYNRIICSDKY